MPVHVGEGPTSIEVEFCEESVLGLNPTHGDANW